MFIDKNDEAKRSQWWRIVTTVATVLIIVIGVFFVTRLFTSNPLEGTWQSEDTDVQLLVKGNNALIVRWPEIFEETNVKIKMEYTLDKDAKTITIKENTDSIKKAVKASKGRITESNLRSALREIVTTFNYNVENNELTLQEREYGEQFVFVKK